MSNKTHKTLNDINRAFYESQAAHFSETRSRPWRGWIPVVSRLKKRAPSTLSVLDVGCGNGRFYRYLSAELGCPIRYVGVDASQALLNTARNITEGDECTWVQSDFAENGLSPDTESGFDLVVLFGVMHHIPGCAARRDLITSAASRLFPGGLLVVSIWQFAQHERFLKRTVPWSEAAQRLDISLEDIEPGDHLLRWGNDASAHRYCHAVSQDEANQWETTCRIKSVETYEADGNTDNLNAYILFGHAESEDSS